MKVSFLQNNYEDESTDEKLNKELLSTLKKKSNQIEFGSLMLNLNIPNWDKITTIIKKDDIYEKNDEFGIENEPHITILYGFHDEVNADQVFKLFNKNFELKSIQIEINKISIFENDEFDVVKFDVISKELTKINSIMRELPNTLTFPKYHPHLTLAYLKKGTGKKYMKNLNKKYILTGDELIFSTKNEKKKRLKLNT